MKHESRITNENPTLVYLGSYEWFDVYVDVKWNQLLVCHGNDGDYRCVELSQAPHMKHYATAYQMYTTFITMMTDHINQITPH